MRSRKPPIWGTHLRWMALCPEAWRIVVNGRIPIKYTTPVMVSEVRSLHDKIVGVLYDWLSSNAPLVVKEYKVAYFVWIRHLDEWREIVVKPDLYALWKLGREPVNLVVEVTSRTKRAVSEEWLTSYMIGMYLENLRPTITILVTPEEVKALPLSSKLVYRLEKLLEHPPLRTPGLHLCSNCDLRNVCPNPRY